MPPRVSDRGEAERSCTRDGDISTPRNSAAFMINPSVIAETSASPARPSMFVMFSFHEPFGSRMSSQRFPRSKTDLERANSKVNHGLALSDHLTGKRLEVRTMHLLVALVPSHPLVAHSRTLAGSALGCKMRRHGELLRSRLSTFAIYRRTDVRWFG